MPPAVHLAGLFKIHGEHLSSIIMTVLGPVLILALFSLLILVTSTYFMYVLPRMILWHSFTYCAVVTLSGLCILLNSIFNYVMCVVVGPGNPSGQCSGATCSKCAGPKPPRSHHCSVCGKCVLKMDHHCPWIHNCVGHYNHRYFLLFLTYIAAGCLFMVVFTYPCFQTRPRGVSVKLSFVLCSVFFIVLSGFTGWHWFLGLRGSTTIEFFGQLTAAPESLFKYSFSRGSWRKNLELIFGTTSVLRALLPRHRKLQFNGALWPDSLHTV